MSNLFCNLDDLQQFVLDCRIVAAIDVGGSLIKMVISKKTDKCLIMSNCHSAIFDLKHFEGIIALLKTATSDSSFAFLGGGSFRQRTFITNNFASDQLLFIDEMQCISKGAIYLSPTPNVEALVINVGSGISVLKVNSPKDCHRILGSCIGGGTFMGLIKACISNTMLFQESIDLASNGNSVNCDLLVSDIYGDSYPGLSELPGNLVASSMGNYNLSQDSKDVSSSILNMVIIHIAQLAFFGSQLHPSHQLLFSGTFFSDRDQYIKSQLKDKLKYWNLDGHVLPLNPFVGCIGALVKLVEDVYFTN